MKMIWMSMIADPVLIICLFGLAVVLAFIGMVVLAIGKMRERGEL